MEIKKQAKQKNPEDAPLKLIQGIGDLPTNPILVKIVEAAPSPTAADNYIVHKLGWLNNLGIKIRNAVRLKERFPDVWKKLKITHIRPVDSIFTFNPDVMTENFLISEFEKPIIPCSEASFEGDQSQMSSWPFLLQELQYRQNPVINSFDGDGQQCFEVIRKEHFDNLSKGDFRHFFDYTQTLCATRISLDQESWHFSIVTNGKNVITIFKNLGTDMEIMSQSVMVQGESGNVSNSFPSFYKILYIKHEEDLATIHEYHDEILIILRQDLGPASQKKDVELGKVIHRTTIITPQAQITLAVEYCVHSSFRDLHINQDIDNKIKITFDGDTLAMYEDHFGERTGQVVKELSGYLYLCYKSPAIPLTKIAGKDLILSPPKNLSSLFLEDSEKSSE